MKNKFFAILILLSIIGLFATAAMAAPIGNPIASVQTSVAASNLVAKAAAGYLNSFTATDTSTAGYVLIFDATALPSNGTITPRLCYELASSSSIQETFFNPIPFNTGIVLGFSTTGCYSLTASTTAFLSAQVQ